MKEKHGVKKLPEAHSFYTGAGNPAVKELHVNHIIHTVNVHYANHKEDTID